MSALLVDQIEFQAGETVTLTIPDRAKTCEIITETEDLSNFIMGRFTETEQDPTATFGMPMAYFTQVIILGVNMQKFKFFAIADGKLNLTYNG